MIAHAVRSLGCPGIIDLVTACRVPDESRLLRYPLRMPGRQIRERALSRLDRAGLGASRMYGAALEDVPGVAPMLARRREGAAAREFAARLLTLPVHSGVGEADVERMRRCLAESLD